MAKHKCRAQGDHIVRIAREKGYHDWKRVWHENGPLKGKRANPLVLFKGDRSAGPDEVTLPPKKNHSASQGTGEEKTYVVPAPKLCLRLRLLFPDFKPLKDSSFELTLQDGTRLTGTTDAQGHVKVDGEAPVIPDADTSAKLVVRTPSQASGQNGLDGESPVTWQLGIGKLNPIMESAPNSRCLSGVQARLNNLGIDAGPVDGIMGPNTRAAVEAFQSLFDLAVDGIPGQGETQPKLREVYDEGSFSGPPPGERAVKHPVPEDQRLPVAPEHLGHVAPDFADASSPFVNTLVIRPQYRIVLELGKLEDLFLHKAGSDLGRMERLQVAGLHYFPMGHKIAGDALTPCWTYWTDKLSGGGDPDDKLEEHVKSFVVDGWTLPEHAPEGTDPKTDAAKHYRKIRVPGGHNYRDEASQGRFHPLHDPSYPLGFGRKELHDAEGYFLKDNPAVGSVPLIARVEQRPSPDAEWEPAQGVAVYFQLAMPYDLPDFDTAVSPAKQINRPPLSTDNLWTGAKTGAGQDKLDAAVRAKGLLPDDPHVDNCPSDQGGKRGKPVAGNLFEVDVEVPEFAGPGKITKRSVKPRPGFRAPLEGSRADDLQPLLLNAPEAGLRNGVRVLTNEAGVAGVVFRPSTKGGDRYRLKAFVGRPDYDNDGTGPEAISVETGTFVVWRNCRLIKTLRLDYADMSDEVLAQFNSHFKQSAGKTYSKADILRWSNESRGLQKYSDHSKVGYPSIDLSETGDPKYAYDSYTKELARAWCEVEHHSDFTTPETITDERWRKALQAAADFAKQKANNKFKLDIDKLLMLDKAKVTAADSHVFIPMYAPLEYNKQIGSSSKFKKIACTSAGTFNTANKKAYDGWFDDVILGPFVHSLVEGGLLPGMWLVQMPTISNWHRVGILGDYSIGLGYSCTVLNGGKDDFPYAKRQDSTKSLERDGKAGAALEDTGFDGLVVHELGHCMFRLHAPPDPAPSATKIHDPIGNLRCVMTYVVNEGHYCAKCLFALRGWSSISSL